MQAQRGAVGNNGSDVIRDVNRQVNGDVNKDTLLIRRGLKGDAQALETLFAEHKRPLYQTALRVLGNPEDAEDAVQDGLLSAYRNLPRFEGRSQFSTWLTRIVINAALMRRRSRVARPAISLDEPPREHELPAVERFTDRGPTPEQVYQRRELHEMIRENLDELSPLLRTAFVLREVQGFSTGEAAEKLGVTENTLKARLWRARQQMADRLKRRMRKDYNESARNGALRREGFAGRLCCEGA